MRSRQLSQLCLGKAESLMRLKLPLPPPVTTGRPGIQHAQVTLRKVGGAVLIAHPHLDTPLGFPFQLNFVGSQISLGEKKCAYHLGQTQNADTWHP